ncbi:M23 family metallopeptidase [Streptomyces sp. UH6]|uniref:M23 family metallopeptidase n=1 Tax=Streptomyces sp. UH6 TaxID=2748379 RepID=UPI0015D4EF01|nr:M23 family metallopeptidase [Streptomyces sp. UH6]NYV74960.1 peptidoglycan DD-metalloendopeptidase family protein [Streptomyces sp. UH6]
MPAKHQKHRRPTGVQRLTRSIAVAGTGAVALGLPLFGAAGAHAAPQQGAQSLPVAAKKAASETYKVKKGDSLAKIADKKKVAGGWKKLYKINRDVVGDNPRLIKPGTKLDLGKKAAAKPAQAKAAAPKTEAPKTTVADAAAAGGYTAPADAALGTAYRTAGSMWSSGYHTGVDFALPTGTPLKSIAAGTVVSAGNGGAYGNQVVIQHEDGMYSQYAHLSQLSVSAGQTVTVGQQIGLSGATGNVTGPHLHFEVRTSPDYGSDVDPVGYLRSHGVSVG